MALAQDIITIEIGGATVRLRPSLRAALWLVRQFGGYAELLQALGEGSVTAATAIITEAGDHPAPESLITAPSPEALRDRLERLHPQLALLVLMLADVSPPATEYEQPEPDPVSDDMTVEQALIQIFGLATGVLGWSPATAWASTPGEVWTAMQEHVAMIRAANGVAPPKRKRVGPDMGKLDSAGLADLAAMGV